MDRSTRRLISGDLERTLARRRKRAGRLMRAWIESRCETVGYEPVVDEISRLAERLEEVRIRLSDPNLPNSDRIRMMRIEAQLQTAMVRLWERVGLLDADDVDPPRSRGRPAASDVEIEELYHDDSGS